MFQAKDGTIDPSVVVKPRVHRALSDTTLKRLFLWPTLALLITFNIFPLLYSLYVSFTEFSAISGNPPVWIGLQNYQSILSDPKRAFPPYDAILLLSPAAAYCTGVDLLVDGGFCCW